MTQPPDGQRPPGDFFRSPAPPPPPPPQPEPAGRHQPQPDQEPPLTVRRAAFHFTAIAVLLMFLGVLMVTQIGSTAPDVKSAVDELQPELSQAISLGQIRAIIAIGAGLLIVMSLGHALTAHGLRGRKSWTRPVGFTFGGILAGFGLLALIPVNIPFVILGLGALWGILLLAKPEVRDYLNPRADAFGPRTPPAGR